MQQYSCVCTWEGARTRHGCSAHATPTQHPSFDAIRPACRHEAVHYKVRSPARTQFQERCKQAVQQQYKVKCESSTNKTLRTAGTRSASPERVGGYCHEHHHAPRQHLPQTTQGTRPALWGVVVGGAASARSDNCYCRELPAALCGCCRGSPSAAVCCCCWLWCLGPGCDWRCTTHPAAPAACGCCAGGSAAAHCCWGHRHHHWCCPSLLCQSPPPAPPQARPADPVPTPTPSHFSATQTRDHPLPSHSHHPPSHSPRTPSHYQPPPLP